MMTNEPNNDNRYLDDNNSCPQYNSLNDIRLRKEALRKSIEADDKKIKTLWNSLFTKPDAFKKDASRSKRLQSMMSIGMGAFDGALLAWKLYRKFKKRNKRILLSQEKDMNENHHKKCGLDKRPHFCVFNRV